MMVRRHQRIRVLPGDLYAQFFRSVTFPTLRDFPGFASPERFICFPAPGRVSLEVHVIAFSMITDDAPQPDGFGGDAALTNGIEVGVFKTLTDDLLFDFLDGETIKTNAEFSQLAGSRMQITPPTPTGTANDNWHVAIEWQIAEQNGAALLLAPGTSIRLTLNDIITTDHALSLTALAIGVYEK